MAVAGNYTCLLRNDTHKMEHHVELIVKSKIRLLRHTAKETHWLTFPISADSPPETPLATFEPQSLQELQEGDLARFYCEAFVGNLNLPDEKSEISWHRLSRHGELQKLHSVEIVKRCVEELIRFARPFRTDFYYFHRFREDEQVLGAILSLKDLREEDYGEYLCRIEMANPQHRLEMKTSLHISPTVAKTVSNIHIINTVGAILAAFLSVFLFICVVFLRRHSGRRHNKLNSLPHREQMYDTATIEMSFRQHPSTSTSPYQSRQ